MLNDFIQIEGIIYRKADVSRLLAEKQDKLSPALSGLFTFLEEWFNDLPTVEVQTSGSTGEPKIMEVSKEKMVYSARMTCDFLHLQPGDTALLCMSMQYIGAKMMVVRAITAGLNLIVREASGHPLADVSLPLSFAAMVPLQVYNSLQVQEEKEKLARIDRLIIGGGPIDSGVENELSGFPNTIYSTYGMTETLSHIALRRINGKDATREYITLGNTSVSLSPDNTLVIHAPGLIDEPLITNDIARIGRDGRFTILGRKDNIINTGGKKIEAERIESSLTGVIPVPFAVTSVPDPKFGEAIVLLIGDNKMIDPEITKAIRNRLPGWHQPRHILIAGRIPTSGNHKIDRKACRELALQLIDQSAGI